MSDPSSPITGMVLAAGLGTRMRPITDSIPKPLVQVAGQSLLDHALDALTRGGIHNAIVNVHYLADQIEDHLRQRRHPAIQISDERSLLLDSGGGVKRALADRPDGTVVILNADSFWIDEGASNICRLLARWNPHQMDKLLLLARPSQATGYHGEGDFFMDDRGALTRRGSSPSAPYVYAGAIVTKVSSILAVSDDVFSLNRMFDQSIASNRLYGCLLDGLWLHVGTPASIDEAEQAIERHATPS